jgi:hypothetical protein
MTEEAISQKTAAASTGPRDLLARLYREIGISAVAAALQLSEKKPEGQKQPEKQELPHFLQNDEAA